MNKLVFNDTTNNNGLIQQCEINLFGDNPFGEISGNTSRLAIFTNYLNEAVSRYAHIALMADYNWEWDDRNQIDLPIGTTSLAINTQDYSFATEHTIITAVEIKDTNGKWSALTELDERFFTENGYSITDYKSGATGTPTEYTKVANSIFLYPTPSYTQASSLKVHFKRAPTYYTVSDTTKVQGFSELQSTYLSDYASWKYASSRTLPMANSYRQEIQIWEEVKIPELYSKRSAEHSKIIRSLRRSSR